MLDSKVSSCSKYSYSLRTSVLSPLLYDSYVVGIKHHLPHLLLSRQSAIIEWEN